MGTSQHISPLQFRSISFSQGSRGIASPRPILMLISWLWVPLEQASSINSIPNPRDSKPVVIISQKTFIMVNFGILTILKCTVQQHLVHSKCYATFWFQDIFYSKSSHSPFLPPPSPLANTILLLGDGAQPETDKIPQAVGGIFCRFSDLCRGLISIFPLLLAQDIISCLSCWSKPLGENFILSINTDFQALSRYL